MKLLDFIKNLETKKQGLFSNYSSNASTDETLTINAPNLKLFEKQLYECEEFQNVIRINFLDSPHYVVDKETQEPLNYSRNFLGGDTDTKSVRTFKFSPDEEIKFNKFVDIYSIRIGKIFNSKEEITKPGIWVYPTTYNAENFTQDPNQIRVIWDQGQLEKTLSIIGASETPKQRLIRMFTDAVNSMEPNIPCEYVVFIRCSARSIANENKLTQESLEGFITIDVNIPPPASVVDNENNPA